MELREHLNSLLSNSEPFESTYNNAIFLEANSISIFGAGSFGKDCIKLINALGKKINYIIDNNPMLHGTYILDLPVVSLEEYLNQGKGELILICSTWNKIIEEQLLGYRYKNYLIFPDYFRSVFYKYTDGIKVFTEYFNENYDKFNEVYNMLEDESSKQTYSSILAFRLSGNMNILECSQYPQYFHPEVLPKGNEVIIDGGAYIGDTVDSFMKSLDHNCEIYSFEPFIETFEKLEQTINSNGYIGVTPINAGLSDKTADLLINAPGIIYAGNHIVEDVNGRDKIHVTTIDNFVYSQGISKLNLIKLDIEGSELPALKGAIKTLLTLRPKLQICIYHSKEEMMAIPLFLKELFKDIPYQYYVGHHDNSLDETVLYAIAD